MGRRKLCRETGCFGVGDEIMKTIFLNEGSYAFILAQIALLNCEVAGMQAENQHRMATSNSISYGDEAFHAVQKKYEAMIGCNEILEMAGGS